MLIELSMKAAGPPGAPSYRRAAMDANMAISPSCTRAWTVNLCRGDGGGARFCGWRVRNATARTKRWTAGLMALRGGHQSRSGRPIGCIPWWSAERTQCQPKG